jgi:hypothetical protein
MADQRRSLCCPGRPLLRFPGDNPGAPGPAIPYWREYASGAPRLADEVARPPRGGDQGAADRLHTPATPPAYPP